MATYFDEMKNKMDLKCQVYLGRDGLSDEDKERAISEQLKLIQEVDSFEQKCLANVVQLENFMNQGIIFGRNPRSCIRPPFGRLIIIEDEFMILNEKVKQMMR